MSSPTENDVVAGSGNSQYAAEAGEGPTDARPGEARQEGGPTLLSHDLGNEGFPPGESAIDSGMNLHPNDKTVDTSSPTSQTKKH